jgi:3-deoxy-D-manno-octulosonate 8-phosphate phosphatase KdsC-like HAD superfamily phosphatase
MKRRGKNKVNEKRMKNIEISFLKKKRKKKEEKKEKKTLKFTLRFSTAAGAGTAHMGWPVVRAYALHCNTCRLK